MKLKLSWKQLFINNILFFEILYILDIKKEFSKTIQNSSYCCDNIKKQINRSKYKLHLN